VLATQFETEGHGFNHLVEAARLLGAAHLDARRQFMVEPVAPKSEERNWRWAILPERQSWCWENRKKAHEADRSRR
jgi:hypothetical protein